MRTITVTERETINVRALELKEIDKHTATNMLRKEFDISREQSIDAWDQAYGNMSKYICSGNSLPPIPPDRIWPPPTPNLTSEERDVFIYLTNGFDSASISYLLDIPVAVVKKYIVDIHPKLDFDNYLKHGWI